MAERQISPLLIPLGQPTGVETKRDARGTVVGEPTYCVRLGTSQSTLTASQFGVWALSHGLPQPTNACWSKADFVEECIVRGVGSPVVVIDRLIEGGLLRGVEPTDHGIVEFARSVRLCPLLTGLGNTTEDVLAYRIGSAATIVLTTTPLMYEIYGSSHMYRNLFDAVVDLTRRAKAGGRSEPVLSSPVDVLWEILSQIPSLLVNNSAYLDLARGQV